jgi:tagatose-1,6-bisphosphate aldolase
MTIASLRTVHGGIALLELDQAPALAEVLGLDLDILDNRQAVERLLQTLAKRLGPDYSGLVLDPIYSFAALPYKVDNAGLVLRLNHPAAAVDPLGLPTLIPDWGIEAVKQNYGVAKLSLFYHPSEAKALEKKQLLAELYDYCQHEGVAFFLKLIIYLSPDEEPTPEQFQADQLAAVQELRGFCDLIGLQPAQDPLSAATLTAELDIPWVVTTDGLNYLLAKEAIRSALDNGAQGYVVGDSLWADIGLARRADMSPDWSTIDQQISRDIRDRVLELSRILRETQVEPVA